MIIEKKNFVGHMKEHELRFATFRNNLCTSSNLNVFCDLETIVFCISAASCPKESSVE